MAIEMYRTPAAPLASPIARFQAGRELARLDARTEIRLAEASAYAEEIEERVCQAISLARRLAPELASLHYVISAVGQNAPLLEAELRETELGIALAVRDRLRRHIG